MTEPPPTSDWSWPVDVFAFDHSSKLSTIEEQALADTISGIDATGRAYLRRSLPKLQRLDEPIHHVFGVMGTENNVRCTTRLTLLQEMLHRGREYWGWSTEEWLEILRGESPYARVRGRALEVIRRPLMAVAYLLCGYNELHAVGSSYVARTFCERIFGKERFGAVWRGIYDELTGWGWGAATLEVQLPRVVSQVMLAHRSPDLNSMTVEELEQIRQRHLPKALERDLVKVSRVLAARGVIAEPLKLPKKSWLNNKMENDDCPQEWEWWCRRWRDTSTNKESTRKTDYNVLLQAGRWLARNHPKITSPQQWTRELAAEYVAAMCRLTVGEYSDKDRMSADKVGRSVKPWTKSVRIGVMCTFFQDSQEWGWIRANFDPRRAFRTPKSIKANLTVEPRTIEDDIWSKLLWAGLNLSTEDLPVFGGTNGDNDPFKSVLRYPLEMMRAVTLVWLFAGLRVDEIIRLPLGCIRWQREEVTVKGTAETLPKDAVCWLDVPVNKTSEPFTKPVDRVVGEAIEVWQAVRPEQPAGIDQKAAETVHFLFAYRGMPLASSHINETLIPMLCRKAGVPTEDARGNITSHRARSTIASQLANAKEPMTLFELQQWLGHKTPAATQHYVKSTLTRLAKSYSDAEYFKRNIRMIEVLIDGEAIRNGTAADGEPWKYYDLGHGYCTYDFFQECPHRMACARCAFYVPKGSVKEQFLEGKAGLSRMREEIPLTEDETAAVDEGIELHTKLIDRLADVPTPAGQTPRQLQNQTAQGQQSTNGEGLVGAERSSSTRQFVPLQKKQRQG